MINIANYLIKKIPTLANNSTIPYKVLNANKSKVNHICIFGCKTFIFITKIDRNKLEYKFFCYVLVRFDELTKTY